VISLNLVLAGLRLGLKNRQVDEKWVSDDCSYLCKGRTAITPVTITNTGVAASYYSISPVISNGLSFGVINGTITISGTPIVASDPVTYVVTANGFFSNDTATVVITIGVGTTNLAFGKPAIQSSNYYETDRYHASQTVNGNTMGVWYTSSIIHSYLVCLMRLIE
jgi:hypothetical protein